ncbi:hypothetical protein NSMM_370004 [Nitrosomonas mobilis]|uniref:Uncharacterized protein n=1 Tax=Nitrosomonas mobilis TaxID=51642 RepID=A0A1G5SDG6_9PROT|nr:hypothetical protein NSMM_370004 [Nitrosomonas mobilis]
MKVSNFYKWLQKISQLSSTLSDSIDSI